MKLPVILPLGVPLALAEADGVMLVVILPLGVPLALAVADGVMLLVILPLYTGEALALALGTSYSTSVSTIVVIPGGVAAPTRNTATHHALPSPPDTGVISDEPVSGHTSAPLRMSMDALAGPPSSSYANPCVALLVLASGPPLMLGSDAL